MIDSAISDLKTSEVDDLAWAKPLVDEALAAFARREVMSLEEHRARNKKRLAVQALEGDELARAQPPVDEALPEVDRGDVPSFKALK